MFLLQNDALLDIFIMHCGICEMGLLHLLPVQFFLHWDGTGSQNLPAWRPGMEANVAENKGLSFM